MAYVTDYTQVVPYNTSIAITMTDVCSTAADMLVSNFRLTLVGYGTAGVASSATNYAEVVWQGLHIRMYSTSSSSYSFIFAGFFEGNTNPSFTTTTTTIPSEAGVSATITLRKIVYKGGNVCQLADSSMVWYTRIIQFVAQNISSEVNYYGITYVDTSGSACYALINDGNKLVHGYYPSCAIYDVAGAKQILTQLSLMYPANTGNYSRMFLVKYIYHAGALTFSGVADINGKTFYGDGNLVYELAQQFSTGIFSLTATYNISLI